MSTAANPGLAARDAEDALDLIVGGQADPSTACAYLGTERDGVLAELEALAPPWGETLRVIRDDRGVAAVSVVDWDVETGRAWIHGPWARDDDAWAASARRLVEEMIARTPTEVTDYEISASPVHGRMAELAAELGWGRSDINIAYVTRGAGDGLKDLSKGLSEDESSGGPTGWPTDEEGVRAATPDDLADIDPLHQAAFPGTYATARALLADEERLTLRLDVDGEFAGYASAEIQPDGAGYLDFIAIVAAYRGRSLSKPLLAAICRRILAASTSASVSLTVKESNHAAVALYESFGFVRDAELVGYRNAPYTG